MTTDHPTPSKPKRRWFQFSLRTLFVLVTVLCVWMAVVVNRARKQREAVAAIRELGGKVYYDDQVDSTGRFSIRAKPPRPTWLRELIGDEYFVSVFRVFLEWDQCTCWVGHVSALHSKRLILLVALHTKS